MPKYNGLGNPTIPPPTPAAPGSGPPSRTDTHETSSPITLTATAVSPNPFLVPTGNVIFSYPGGVLGVVPMDDTGTATLTIPGNTFPVGEFEVVAYYSGDANFLAGVTTPIIENIIPAFITSVVAVSLTTNTIQYLQIIPGALDIVVTVSGGNQTPTGSITLQDNGTDIGGTQSLSGGQTTYDTYNFYPINTPAGLPGRAVLSSSQNLPASTINVLSTKGFPTSGSLMYPCSNTGVQIVSYTNITLTSFTGCTVTGAMPGGTAGSGNSFLGSSITLIELPPAIALPVWLSATPGGQAHNFTAIYSGDANYTSGTSPVQTLTVAQATASETKFSSFTCKNDSGSTVTSGNAQIEIILTASFSPDPGDGNGGGPNTVSFWVKPTVGSPFLIGTVNAASDTAEQTATATLVTIPSVWTGGVGTGYLVYAVYNGSNNVQASPSASTGSPTPTTLFALPGTSLAISTRFSNG